MNIIWQHLMRFILLMSLDLQKFEKEKYFFDGEEWNGEVGNI